MATYKQIQAWVKANFSFVPKTCWIAHAKELSGIPVNRSIQRQGQRKVPCLPNKLVPIQSAFKHFGMLD